MTIDHNEISLTDDISNFFWEFINTNAFLDYGIDSAPWLILNYFAQKIFLDKVMVYNKCGTLTVSYILIVIFFSF